MSCDQRSGEIRGVIDEGLPLLMREETGVGDGRWWKEIREEERKYERERGVAGRTNRQAKIRCSVGGRRQERKAG